MSRDGLREAGRFELLVRSAKVAGLRARRLVDWQLRADAFPKPEVAAPELFAHRVHVERIGLARCDAGVDPRLEAGKQFNVALAAPSFDGMTLSAERPFSFWRSLGRPTKARGFRHGMELRGGCIVPTVGGGLCLISNALFRAACALGWTIIERHGHTMDAAPDDRALWGMDATVFWPFVDLRFAPPSGEARLGLRVRGDVLELEVRSNEPSTRLAVLREVGRADSGDQRSSQIERDVIDRESEQVVATDVVAINRKRLLEVKQQKRNCLTCEEYGCRARPTDLDEVAM